MKKYYLLIIFGLFFLTSNSQITTFYPIKENGKWGYIDEKGKKALTPQYDFLGSFEKNLAIIKKEGKFGLIDTNLQIIIPCRYNRIQLLKEGYFITSTNTSFQLYHLNKKLNNPNYYKAIKHLSKDLFIYKTKGYWKLTNESGLQLCDSSYDSITIYNDYIMTFKNQQKGLLFMNGKIILDAKHDDIKLTIDGKHIIYGHFGRYTILNIDSNKTLNSNIEFFSEIDKRYLIIKKEGQYALFNLILSETLIPLKNGNAGKFNDDLLFYSEGGKMGLIDYKTGNIIFSPEFDNISFLNNSIALAYKGELIGLIDRRGNKLTPVHFKSVTQPNAFGWMVFKKETNYGVVDSTGKEVLKDEYREIILNDDKVMLRKDTIIHLIDFDEKGKIIDRNHFKRFISINANYKTFSGSQSTPFTALPSNQTVKARKENFWYLDSTCNRYGLMSPDEIFLILPKYKNVRRYANTPYSIVSIPRKGNEHLVIMNSHFGIVNHTIGKEVIRPVYQYIHDDDIINKSLYIRVKLGKSSYNLLKDEGNYFSKPYKDVSYFDFNKNPIIAFSGEVIKTRDSLKTTLGLYRKYYNGYNRSIKYLLNYFHLKNSKWGVLNEKGIWDIEPNYGFIRRTPNQQYICMKDELWGVIDSTKTVIPIAYDNVIHLKGTDLYQLYKEDYSKGIINLEGKGIVQQKYKNLKRIDNDYVLTQNKKYGLLNIKTPHSPILEEEFSKFYESNENVTRAKKGKNLVYYDVNEGYIDLPESKRGFPFSNSRIWLKEKEGYFLYDKEGNQISGPYRSIKVFKNNYAPVKKNDAWFYINSEGVAINSKKYTLAENFNSCGYAKVNTSNFIPLLSSYRIIDTTGQIISNLSRSSKLIDSLIYLRKKGGYELKNLKTKKVSKLKVR